MDPSPRDGCFVIVSDTHGAATSLAIVDFRGTIVPHGRKKEEW